jgi:hypothetical protein
MDKQVTVYFDTSFYIDLAKASLVEADRVIHELNDLAVRHVLSGQIVQELLSNAHSPEKDGTLVDRVSRFRISPLRISSNSFENPVDQESLDWEVLRLDGELRSATASGLRLIFDLQTKAESWSKLARNSARFQHDPKIQKKAEEFLHSMGIGGFEGLRTEEGLGKLLDSSNGLLDLLSKIPNNLHIQTDRIEVPETLDSETLASFSSELGSRLGTDILQKAQQKDEIVDSTTASDDRPYKVVAESASPKESRRLGTTLRDSNTMSLFLAHETEIDLLQLDKAQLSMIINQRNPEHTLTKLGLAKRCFSSNSLTNTVETVRMNINELGL